MPILLDMPLLLLGDLLLAPPDIDGSYAGCNRHVDQMCVQTRGKNLNLM